MYSEPWNRNREGYPDYTAGKALRNVMNQGGCLERSGDMADPERQMIGKRSRASGAAFERWLSGACEFYLRSGWAYIEKTPEPFHITGKDSQGVVRGYYEKKGQPDYKGILCDGIPGQMELEEYLLKFL